jgi:hypothetical protein
MRFITGPIFWLGRVTLWILFLPLGIWRSVVHGRKKSERRQAKLLAAELDRRERDRATREGAR